jgi:eukaryotic-like serine/threonine-protein kinase
MEWGRCDTVPGGGRVSEPEPTRMIIGRRYEVESQLGEGGQGRVYRVRHMELGKSFALKIISPAFAGDETARLRFNNEAKLASEISHPNIVSVVDYGEDPDLGVFMVMEIAHGESLTGPGLLPMSTRAAIDVLRQVADALEHIHKRGIIHGDIKAENVVLAEEPQHESRHASRRRRIARLFDFGLASRHEHRSKEEGINGTPHYIAPERVTGAPASVATDVYALGVLGYLLLTGTLPFDGEVTAVLMAHVEVTPPPMSERRGEALDSALEGLIARAMAKDPAARHPSAAAFLYELNTVADMLGLSGRRSRTSAMLISENPRMTAIAGAFDGSWMPQAILSIEGDIVACNPAFQKFVKDDCDEVSIEETSLAKFVPQLKEAIDSVGRTPLELRRDVSRGASRAALRLTIWLVPVQIVGQEIHLLVRVEEK